MATRKQIVKAIFDNEDHWSCNPEEAHCDCDENMDCVQCASNVLRDYETRIIKAAINNFKAKVLEEAGTKDTISLSELKDMLENIYDKEIADADINCD